MPKAYWIAHVSVENPESYRVYAEGATEAFRIYGGRPLARGGATIALEGSTRPRNVVIEFDSVDAAKRCYDSIEYQAARTFRTGCAVGDIIVVEGVE